MAGEGAAGWAGGCRLKMGPAAGKAGGHIWAPEMKPDNCPAAGRGPALLLPASTPRRVLHPHTEGEEARKDPDATPTAGWRLAVLPGSGRPRQTTEDSLAPGAWGQKETPACLTPPTRGSAQRRAHPQQRTTWEHTGQVRLREGSPVGPAGARPGWTPPGSPTEPADPAGVTADSKCTDGGLAGHWVPYECCMGCHGTVAHLAQSPDGEDPL